MDGFHVLPIELSRLILVEAIKARGLKRAVRLRFVSRAWNLEAVQALFESGILDDTRHLDSAWFWPEYLVFRVMQKGKLLSRPLRIIRRVAERIREFRGEGDSHDVLRKYIFEIGLVTPKYNRDIGVLRLLHDDISEAQEDPLDEDDEDFKQALLAAAVIVDDMDLMKQILCAVKDSTHLISQNSLLHGTIINYPVEAAACKGRVEMLSILLDAIKDPSQFELARSDAMENADDGNHAGIFELCLKAVYPHHDPDLVDSLSRITNPDLFDRVLALCKDHLEYDWRLLHNQRLDELLPGFLSDRFHRAAQHGDLTMMKHLVEIGSMPKDKEDVNHELSVKGGYRSLITLAASGGYPETIVYLFEKGFLPGPRSLEAACIHGDLACVKLLIEFGAIDSFKPGSAVLGAVRRENVSVLGHLMKSGMLNDEVLAGQALEISEQEGLLSMMTMIREAQVARNQRD